MTSCLELYEIISGLAACPLQQAALAACKSYLTGDLPVLLYKNADDARVVERSMRAYFKKVNPTGRLVSLLNFEHVKGVAMRRSRLVEMHQRKVAEMLDRFGVDATGHKDELVERALCYNLDDDRDDDRDDEFAGAQSHYGIFREIQHARAYYFSFIFMHDSPENHALLQRLHDDRCDVLGCGNGRKKDLIKQKGVYVLDERKMCAHCGAISAKKLPRCGVCFDVRYCELDCQMAAWAGHKAACKAPEL